MEIYFAFFLYFVFARSRTSVARESDEATPNGWSPDRVTISLITQKSL
ncbi:hypothetical protein KAI52_02495 [Candidatus Parcubacteria bacterium]|nr:hypothetical protein [Candidatus Parcubacteria bacterium]